MATHRALVLESRDKPLVLTQKQMPEAIAGPAVIKVLANAISPNAKRVLVGEFHTPLSTPTTPSAGAIGRIHAVGPDAASLQEGQLVVTDFCISARDNPNVQILQGYMGFHPILDSHWSDGTYAEYARVPLERCWSLNEKRLTQELGYSLADLAFLPTIAVPHGGLQEIQIQAGDTVIVAPATGYFGGAAVHAAIACGARVIAAGRNTAVLSKLESVFGSTGRIKTVTFSGDVKADTKALIEASGSSAGADKYIDFSPPQSFGSKHVTSCIEALRPFGRCVLMGLVYGGVEIPYATVGLKCIRIQGRFMFDYAPAQQTIRLAETGMLKLGSGDQSGVKVQSFKLDDFQRALDQAEKDSSWGNMIVLEP